MKTALKKRNERYSYSDYLNWPETERFELLNGVVYDMTPAPPRRHQEILGEIHRQMANCLLDKPCKVYVAPFDVRLPEENEKDEDIKTVVQPDIALVCNHSKLDERGCKGAPDLVIEIVSPSTVKKDLKDKFLLYEKAGVKEYWIVHPVDKTVMVFTLEEKKYGRPEIYSEEDQVKARVLDDLIVNLKEAFKD
jgi:Uma2 family endonuclease